jgi:hypothetical protein
MLARNSHIIKAIILILAVACPLATDRIIYVDDDATGANDGSS